MTTTTEHNGGVTDTIAQLMVVPHNETDIEWLKKALQNALILELATIPTYSCGLWSIDKDILPIASTPVDCTIREIICEIIFDEMYHVGLVGNMLVGIGGTAVLHDIKVVPKYPCKLPGNVRPEIVVRLTGLTRGSLDMYSQIEKPDNPLARYTTDTTETYPSIGDFYRKIKSTFDKIKPALKDDKQISFSFKRYGTDDEIVRLKTLQEVLKYIDIIMEQGEGTSSSPEKPHYGGTDKLAHYYAFREYYHGRKLKKVNDNKWEFNGEELYMPKTYAVAEVPAGGWPRANLDSNVAEKLDSFNQEYNNMLKSLQDAWSMNKGPEQNASVSTAIASMKKMSELAQEIMKIPLPEISNVSPSSSGWHYCPEFLFTELSG